MSRYLFHNQSFQKWLFLIGGIAFALSLLKNIFLRQYPGTTFYLVEALAFLFFLIAFYISDKNNQFLLFRIKKYKEELINTRYKSNRKIQELTNTIVEYEKRQNDKMRFASYRDKVVQKLIQDPEIRTNYHHFLFLLAELFHGMAIIWYKKDKPEGPFIVEKTFGLPDDFEPKPFFEGEGLHGQAITDRKPTVVEEIPPEYCPVETALGESKSYYLYLLPIIKENECTGLIEVMSFKASDAEHLWPETMEKLVEHDIL
ncbi:GAF domain-containing protein [Thermophagus sp. OGC60D27]|uniref:GAF domain-containing protein n=1 Tax=Thermophagus sp. OGC60D27 TaxID=3458415 RepID=UPI004037B99C